MNSVHSQITSLILNFVRGNPEAVLDLQANFGAQAVLETFDTLEDFAKELEAEYDGAEPMTEQFMADNYDAFIGPKLEGVKQWTIPNPRTHLKLQPGQRRLSGIIWAGTGKVSTPLGAVSTRYEFYQLIKLCGLSKKTQTQETQ